MISFVLLDDVDRHNALFRQALTAELREERIEAAIALEAAARAGDPRVDVMLRNAPDDCEILISNTFPEGADLSFLSAGP